jgi:biopolymer transport protein ExbB
MKRLALSLVTLLCLVSTQAIAKWSSDWSEKTPVVLDTTAQGGATKSAVGSVVVPVRLHTGNFDFTKAKPDGSDIRFVAADDKTVLPHQVEVFDVKNELAVLWVALGSLLPNQADQKITLYYGNPKADAPGAAPVYDPKALGVVHVGADPASLANSAGAALAAATTGAGIEAQGVTGTALKFNGAGAVNLSGPGAQLPAEGLTLSFWARTGNAIQASVLLRATTANGALEVALDAGVPTLRTTGTLGAGTAKATAPLKANAWQHFAILIGERVALVIDGQEVATLATKLPVGPLQLVLADKFTGDADELQVHATARTPDWIRATFASQATDDRMVRAQIEEESGGEAGYLKILFDNLPLDAIIVIAILGVMAVVAAWVMFDKSMLIMKSSKANEEFMKRFRSLGEKAFIDNSMPTGTGKGGYHDSTLYSVYNAAREALAERMKGDLSYKLESRSLVAIRSAVDASVLRQNVRLNKFMVLLTIAISGGPFLGLLGTVVGVMITFAAIAAVGDVNVNAIAPGIAAALLATVAGLAVAIPALFGYNYLTSRLKDLSNDTMMFGDEVVSRLNETHGI